MLVSLLFGVLERTVDSVACGEVVPPPSPIFPIWVELDVWMQANITTMKVMTRPMIDCASKLVDKPLEAWRILPRTELHVSMNKAMQSVKVVKKFKGMPLIRKDRQNMEFLLSNMDYLQLPHR